MCGNVGVIGDLVVRDEHLMKRLLFIDWLRGPDSTGMAAIRKNGEVPIVKVADHPLILFDTSKFKTALNGTTSIGFIGHNRAATRGVVNYHNAHPFNFENITGTHNGTLDWGCIPALEDAVGEKFPVDSQLLLAAIAKLGLKEAMSLSAGAWSLVWHDSKDNSFNLLRNAERPMYYAYTKEFNKLIYASEWEILEAAVKLTGGYELFVEDKTYNRYFETKENTHYKWDIPAIVEGGTKIPKPTIKTVNGKAKETVNTGPNNNPFCRTGNNGTNTGTHRQGTGTGSGSTKTTGSRGSGTSDSSGARRDVFNFVGKPESPFGQWISHDEFIGYTKYGCSWCEGEVPWAVPGVIVYERDATVLCPKCSGESRRNTVIAKNRLYA